MKRADLIAALKKIEPALSGKELVPILSCFCFTKTHVFAYDDVVAMQVPFESGLELGLKGRLLLDTLSNSKSTEIEWTVEGTEVQVKAGRTKLKLASESKDLFVFKFPEDTEASASVAIDKAFAEDLSLALVSMGRDPSFSWRNGVTVAFDDYFSLYATDNKGVTKVVCNVKTPDALKDKATIFVPRFCELFSDISRRDPPTKLLIADDWVEAKFESGLRLFAKTLKDVDLARYDGVINPTMEAVEGKMIPVPSGLSRCLQRAEVVTRHNSKEPWTHFSVLVDKLNLKTESPSGDCVDAITIPTHSEISVRADPSMVVRALDYSETMAIIDSCIVMKSPGFTHLVATITD